MDQESTDLAVIEGLYSAEINVQVRPHRQCWLICIGAGNQWVDSAEFDRIEDGVAWLRGHAIRLFPDASVDARIEPALDDEFKAAEEYIESPAVGLEILEQLRGDSIVASIESEWDCGYRISLAGPAKYRGEVYGLQEIGQFQKLLSGLLWLRARALERFPDSAFAQAQGDAR